MIKHVKFRHSCQILMKLEFPRQIFEKYLNLNFNPLNAELNPICRLLALLGDHHIFHVSWLRVNESPSGTNRVVPYGRADMTDLIVAFRKFPNAPIFLP
jgi:hypothetical protein